jgi:hypothetical protein
MLAATARAEAMHAERLGVQNFGRTSMQILDPGTRTFIDRIWDHWYYLLGVLLMIEPLVDYY